MSTRLFVGQQEIDFFNSISKELIQDIVGQKIFYYAISDKLTNGDALYGEAVKKTAFKRVEVNARILYNNPDQTVTNFSIDTVYTIEVYFLLDELMERGIVPREGDFVQYGKGFYEVQKLTMPQTTYGQIDHQVQVKAICHIARKGQFNVDPVKDAT